MCFSVLMGTKKQKEEKPAWNVNSAPPDWAQGESKRRLAVDSEPDDRTSTEKLNDPEFVEKLADELVASGHLLAACKNLGVNRRMVYAKSRHNQSLADAIFAAKKISADQLVDEVKEIIDDPTLKTAEKHVRCEYRLRIAGMLRRDRYGERPHTEVNVTSNTAIVASQEDLARIQAVREKLLLSKPTMELTISPPNGNVNGTNP